MQVVFALVPPAEYKYGGPCFAVSILFIGALTYIVGEFAALLGCALGVPDAVTAISFVALGTSLPDTFASRAAACESPDADAAIGNVTGPGLSSLLAMMRATALPPYQCASL